MIRCQGGWSGQGLEIPAFQRGDRDGHQSGTRSMCGRRKEGGKWEETRLKSQNKKSREDSIGRGRLGQSSTTAGLEGGMCGEWKRSQPGKGGWGEILKVLNAKLTTLIMPSKDTKKQNKIKPSLPVWGKRRSMASHLEFKVLGRNSQEYVFTPLGVHHYHWN